MPAWPEFRLPLKRSHFKLKSQKSPPRVRTLLRQELMLKWFWRRNSLAFCLLRIDFKHRVPPDSFCPTDITHFPPKSQFKASHASVFVFGDQPPVSDNENGSTSPQWLTHDFDHSDEEEDLDLCHTPIAERLAKIFSAGLGNLCWILFCGFTFGYFPTCNLNFLPLRLQLSQTTTQGRTPLPGSL